MRILILGGTGFIGRHLTELALANGHAVSLFNRGKSGQGLFPEAELLVGDRLGDFTALEGRCWDLCFDIASYFPRMTQLSSEVLAGKVGHYTLISTMALYADHSVLNNNEESPVAELEDATVEEVTSKTYGGLKALCEKVVHDYFSDKALIARPGVIAGRYDTTDRFTYWVNRIAEGGDVLVPECWDQPTQYIDAVDLMEWLLGKAEIGLTGTYNLTGDLLPFGKMLEAINEEFGGKANFVRANRDFLIAHLEKPRNDMPQYMPFEDWRGFLHIDSAKAKKEGLRFRSIKETIQDIYEWQKTLSPSHRWIAGIDREKEEELIALWKRVNV